MFDQNKLYDWLKLLKADNPFEEAFHCSSRDIFQARLDNLYQQTKNPLLAAVAGEIGNNSFDHNLGSWRDVAGVYFKNFENNLLVIADRGQGIRKTLGRIVPDIKNDEEAIQIAFTKVISGRSPEQRGNGLKFVASVAKENDWNLFFISGNGEARLSKGEIEFLSVSESINGCAAILRY